MAEPADFSPVHGHLRCLGLALPQALAALGQTELRPSLLAGATGRHFCAIGAQSRVLVTLCGSYGDPGSPGNAWLINLDADSRDRMLRSNGGLDHALCHRHCWLGQAAPRFAPRPVMSQVTGLDNRALLPPYFPVFRGEDRLFGAMLNLLHPGSLALEYDWAVPHLPLERRRGNPTGDSAAPLGSLSLVSRYLDEALPTDEGLPTDRRWLALVERLQELAEGSDAALRSIFARGLTTEQALTLQTLSDQQQDASHGSAPWSDYLGRQAELTAQALRARPAVTAIPGVPAAATESELLARAREFACGYADALRHWPTIRGAAAQLADKLFPV